MKTLFFLIFSLLVLTGCEIFPQPYTRLPSGEVVLSQQQATRLAVKNKIILDKKHNRIALNSQEQTLIEQHPEAAFSLAGQAIEDDHVVSLVRQGSLLANAKRIANENGWTHIVFDIPDQLVEQPFIVTADDLPVALLSLYDDTQVYPCIDEQEKTITFIPSMPNQDTVIHN